MPEMRKPQEIYGDPLDLVSQAALAEMLGISRSRVSQLRSDDALPPPDGLIDEKIPVWTREVAVRFSEERNRSLGRISLKE